MKIRIKGNSIRIRITKTENEKFGTAGYLEEKTSFGNTELTYALQSKPDIDSLIATFIENKITLWVPEKIKNEWVTGNMVGFNNIQETGKGNKLFLLVEKDFVCIDNTFEDQSDNYPNPNAVCK